MLWLENYQKVFTCTSLPLLSTVANLKFIVNKISLLLYYAYWKLESQSSDWWDFDANPRSN